MDVSRLYDLDRASDFVELASVEHAAMYTDAIVQLLLEGGPDRVAMGPVARWMSQVPSAVQQKAGGRESFLRLVVGRFSRRWLAWTAVSDWGSALPVRLPREDDEIHGCRVWSVLAEIAAGEAHAGRPSLARVVEDVGARERAMLADTLARTVRTPTDTEVTLLGCLVAGLRAAMSAAIDPLPPADADAVVSLAADRLGLARSD